MFETTKRKQVGFQKGVSGNPRGRPVGARHKTTLAVEALLEGEAEAIGRKAIEAALTGDLVAIKMVLDRVCPPRKTRSIEIDLPPVTDASGVSQAQQEVLRAVCKGELDLDQAQAVNNLLESRRQFLETAELEARLTELESQMSRGR